MFKKLSTSYNLVKVSFKYIKKDGELLTYSILSILASIILLIIFALIDYYYIGFVETIKNSSETDEVVPETIVYAIIFIYYLSFSFITFFFNTAIITSVQRRNEWKDNKLWDGLRDSMKNIKKIFIWSLINALVTTILQILQNKFWEKSVIWKIIISIVWGIWNILTFFSFPLMILNDMNAKDAIKESSVLFKKTWWERAIINVWVWWLFVLLYMLVILFSIWIIFLGFIITWIIFLILSIIFLSILSKTCDVIIKTILLYYAQNWELPNGLEEEKSIIDIASEK